jgi:hypothetical protein
MSATHQATTAIHPEAVDTGRAAVPSDDLLTIVVETFAALADPTHARIGGRADGRRHAPQGIEGSRARAVAPAHEPSVPCSGAPRSLAASVLGAILPLTARGCDAHATRRLG